MYEYRVKKVLKVVDGDTIDVDIDLGFDISFTSRVRLAGIDTPESRTTDKMEKALGLEVKKKIGELIDHCHQNREARLLRKVWSYSWMALP